MSFSLSRIRKLWWNTSSWTVWRNLGPPETVGEVLPFSAYVHTVFPSRLVSTIIPPCDSLVSLEAAHQNWLKMLEAVCSFLYLVDLTLLLLKIVGGLAGFEIFFVLWLLLPNICFYKYIWALTILSYIKYINIVNCVSAFQNYQNHSDMPKEQSQQVKKASQLKASKWNSVIVSVMAS